MTTLSGTGASGLAATSSARGGAVASRTGRPTIRRVVVSGTVARPTITIFGSNFGLRPRHDPATSPDGQQGCPTTHLAGPGYLFGTSLFVQDLNAHAGGFAGQQWDAGIFNPEGEGEFDCVGLLVKSWSATKITLGFGSLYNRDIPDNNYVLSNGDPLRVGVKGVTFDTVVEGLQDGSPGGSTTTTMPSSTSTTSTVPSSTTTTVPSSTTTTVPPSTTSTVPPSTTTTVPPSTTTTLPSAAPTITAVRTSGPAASPTISVSGTGFGAQPAPDPASGPSGQQGCPVTTAAGSGHLFGESLFINDTAAQLGDQPRWTAGENDGNGAFDCVGLVIQSWSATQVTFTFGDLYNSNIPDNNYVLTNGDPIVVHVKGAVFSTNVSGLS